MSSSSPPPAEPGASDPATPNLAGAALWSDSDSGVRAPDPGFTGLVATPADRAMPTIGHIGRYALKYQLGSGGLGTVFAAHDPLLSRLIAVKTLNLTIKEEERESFNTLFINEARAAGGLSHPHIVTVFDAGISDSRAYIAMELLKGRDLRQLRQEGWRATPAQAALIVRRVADALAFAHSKGVIHRDIKPANIFMVGRTQPRVLDFGIARVAHQRDGTGDTLPGAGSPYYMAPEQVRRLPADRRADVFSLGVVLYELLTDLKPFHGSTLKEITTAVLTHEPPLASSVDKNVPRALADIVARAMAKDPEQRFRSARSFARELRQWLDANPVGAEAETTAPGPVAAASPRRRRATIASLGALVVFAVVAGAAGGLAWHASGSHAGAMPTHSVVAAAPSAHPSVAATAPVPRHEPGTVDAPALVTSALPGPSTASPSIASPSPAAIASTSITTAAPPTTASPINATDALLLATLVPTPIPPAAVHAAETPARPGAASPVALSPQATAPHRDGPYGKGVAANGHASTAAAPPRESARDRRAREAREAQDREVASRTPAPVAPATGTVHIAISPWGQVEVDGTPSGAAPPLTELTLPEGKHRIVVRNGDFAPYVTSVNVTGGQTVSLRYKFGS